MAAVIATERRLRTRMPGRELGHAQPSVVDVTLQFTESFRAAHERTVRGTIRNLQNPSPPCSRSPLSTASDILGIRRRRDHPIYRSTSGTLRHSANAAQSVFDLQLPSTPHAA